MRIRSIVLVAAVLSCISFGAQAASVVFGNHAGGLIPSSADFRSREFRSAVAAAAIAHCASYNRVAQITGAVPGYGNYISFTCRIHPAYDPVKASGGFWWWFW